MYSSKSKNWVKLTIRKSTVCINTWFGATQNIYTKTKWKIKRFSFVSKTIGMSIKICAIRMMILQLGNGVSNTCLHLSHSHIILLKTNKLTECSPVQMFTKWKFKYISLFINDDDDSPFTSTTTLRTNTRGKKIPKTFSLHFNQHRNSRSIALFRT